MKNRRVLVVPSHKTMDHIFPAVRHINPYLTILVPLHEAVNDNVRTFSEQVLEMKINADPKLDCKVISLSENDAPYGTKDTWEQVWRSWLLSVHLMEEVPDQPQIKVLLNPELPLGLILSTATTSLSLPSLEIFEFPGGYNVRRNTDDYNPGAALSDQSIQYQTWSQEGIANAFMYAARQPKVSLLLQAARTLALSTSSVETTDKKFGLLEHREIIGDDIKDILAKKGYNPSKPAFSNLIKRTMGFDLETREKVHEPLIERTGKRSTYRLTQLGVIVTSLLPN